MIVSYGRANTRGFTAFFLHGPKASLYPVDLRTQVKYRKYSSIVKEFPFLAARHESLHLNYLATSLTLLFAICEYL